MDNIILFLVFVLIVLIGIFIYKIYIKSEKFGTTETTLALSGIQLVKHKLADMPADTLRSYFTNYNTTGNDNIYKERLDFYLTLGTAQKKTLSPFRNANPDPDNVIPIIDVILEITRTGKLNNYSDELRDIIICTYLSYPLSRVEPEYVSIKTFADSNQIICTQVSNWPLYLGLGLTALAVTSLGFYFYRQIGVSNQLSKSTPAYDSNNLDEIKVEAENTRVRVQNEAKAQIEQYDVDLPKASPANVEIYGRFVNDGRFLNDERQGYDLPKVSPATVPITPNWKDLPSVDVNKEPKVLKGRSIVDLPKVSPATVEINPNWKFLSSVDVNKEPKLKNEPMQTSTTIREESQLNRIGQNYHLSKRTQAYPSFYKKTRDLSTPEEYAIGLRHNF
jgi:hypothetical protein